VLKTAIHDRTETFRLQDEITETGTVDADVVTCSASKAWVGSAPLVREGGFCVGLPLSSTPLLSLFLVVTALQNRWP
jgi:hypothetical protein